MRLATAGDNCIDRYRPPLGFGLAGGNAVNVAVQFKALGHEVHYFGAVGEDAAGVTIRATLAEQGVGLHGLRVIAGAPTAYTDIASASGGERQFLFEEFGATALYRPQPEDVEAMLGMDHVHIGWLRDGGALKRQLVASGVSVSQDVSVNNAPEHLSPEGLTVAFASARPADAVARLQALLASGALAAVVTMGAAGGIASDGILTMHATALAVSPVDTSGAGDSFIAGFLHGHLGGADLAASLRLGAERGRLACLHYGGFAQKPRPLD